jgi:soluble lytic murein transglycosylase-like protein
MLPHVMQVRLTRPAPEMRPTPASAPGGLRSAFAAQLSALRATFFPLSAADRLNAPSRAVAAAATRTAASATRSRAPSGGEAPATMSAWLTTPRQRALADAITRASDQLGVSSDVSLAVAVAESSLDPTARSSDGLSSGTFQVTGPTAADIRRRFREGELVRPQGSDDVALGVAHLGWLHDIFGRDTTLAGRLRTTPVHDAGERTRFAVAAYNAGEGRVARAQERAVAQRRDPTRYENVRAYLPAITQRYVDRVMRYSGRSAPTVRAA